MDEPATDDSTTTGANTTTGPSTTGSGRWYLWAALGALAAVLIVVVVAVAVTRPQPQTSYDDAVRERFLAGCTAQGGEPVRDTCGCLYSELEANVPFERFETIDTELADAVATTPPGQPLALPDDVDALLATCVAEAA